MLTMVQEGFEDSSGQACSPVEPDSDSLLVAEEAAI